MTEKKLKSEYRRNSNLEPYKTVLLGSQLPYGNYIGGFVKDCLLSSYRVKHTTEFCFSSVESKENVLNILFPSTSITVGQACTLYIQGSCSEGKGETQHFPKMLTYSKLRCVCVCVCVCVCELNRVQLFVTPWTVAHHAPLSILFSRQEYWSGLPFSVLLQGIFPTQRRWNLHLLHLCIGRQVLHHCATWETQ